MMNTTGSIKKYKVTLNLSDEQLLLIGKISAQWSAVEWALLRIMEAILGLDAKEARILGVGMNAMERIKVVRLLAWWRLRKADGRDQLFDLLDRVDKAREQRNDVAHGIWSVDPDGNLSIMKFRGGKDEINRIRGKPKPMTDADLRSTAATVTAVYDDLMRWLKKYRSELLP